jgi:penicillin-binding protein-related factor A (putative recombinase)
MPKNMGKEFENDILNSIPKDLFKYKLRDSAASWGRTEGSKTRFTTKNICDFIVFDGIWLHLWELKSHKGNSIPTAPKFNSKGTLTHYGVFASQQLEGLMNEYETEKVVPSVIINFRDKNKTFAISILHVYKAVVIDEKKSLNFEWCEQYGLLIPQQLKGRSKIHWKYDLGVLLDNLIHRCEG